MNKQWSEDLVAAVARVCPCCCFFFPYSGEISISGETVQTQKSFICVILRQVLIYLVTMTLEILFSLTLPGETHTLLEFQRNLVRAKKNLLTVSTGKVSHCECTHNLWREEAASWPGSSLLQHSLVSESAVCFLHSWWSCVQPNISWFSLKPLLLTS